jgi:hypothetical protein
MDQAKPNRRSVRTYTVAALLGLFIAAVVFAMAKRALGHDSEEELGEE